MHPLPRPRKRSLIQRFSQPRSVPFGFKIGASQGMVSGIMPVRLSFLRILFSHWLQKCCLLLALLVLGISPDMASGQSGSVVTVNPDKILVINGKKVFPIGFSPGPPINSQTPAGTDALQELRSAGALLVRMTQTANWDSQ